MTPTHSSDTKASNTKSSSRAKTRTLVFVASAAALVGGWALFSALGADGPKQAWPGEKDAPAAHAAAGPRAAPAPLAQLAFGYPENTRLSYHISYTQENLTDPLKGQVVRSDSGDEDVSSGIRASIGIDGEFALEKLRESSDKGGYTTLAFSWVALEGHRFAVQGQDLFPTAESVTQHLMGRVAEIDIRSDGHVLGMRVPVGDLLFERVLQLVFTETQVHLTSRAAAPGATWVAAEITPQGVANTQYRIVEDTGGAVTIEKTRTAYRDLQALRLSGLSAGAREEKVSGAWTATVAHAQLTSLKGAESIVVNAPGGARLLDVKSQLELTLLGTSAVGPQTRTQKLVARSLGEVEKSFAQRSDEEHAALIKRADGLTPQEFLADLDQYASLGQVPDHARWLWRASGLIRAQPELAEEVGARFVRTGMSGEGREFLLDLLVGAGSEPAQAVLRTALNTPAARGDKQFGYLFQRLNLLKHPSDATLAFVEDKKRNGRGAERDLAINALGSIAGRRFHNGDSATAREIAHTLVEELARETEPSRQDLYLTALGNAGMAETEAAISEHADSTSIVVRHQVANALRKHTSTASRLTLLALCKDASPLVQRRAIASLHKRDDLTANDRLHVEEMVSLRQIHEDAYASVVTLLSPQMRRDPTVERVFDTILAQTLYDNDVKKRIHAIRGD